MKNINFYYDPVSPYAWLASKNLGNFLKNNKWSITPKPVLFAGLLSVHKTTGPAEVPSKRNYVFRDVMRRAEIQGYKFSSPPIHPFNLLKVLRVSTALANSIENFDFVKHALNAVWEEGLDITKDEVVVSLCEKIGKSEQWYQDTINNNMIKSTLIYETDLAANVGIFGVPTFQYKNELFWGADSLDTLSWVTNGNQINDKLYQEVLSRPQSNRK